MTVRRLLISIALAVVGYGSFAWLFPRYDASARWQQRFGRNDAILHGRTIAQSFGHVDVAGWQPVITSQADEPLRRYLDRYGPNGAPSWVDPVSTRVVLHNTRNDDTVAVDFTSSGRPTAFVVRGSVRSTPSSEPAASEAAARIAVASLVGSPPPGSLISAKHDSDGTRFEWSGAPPGRPELTLTTDCIMRGNRPVEIRTRYAIDKQFARKNVAPPAEPVDQVRTVVIVITMVVAIVMTIIAAVRRRFPARGLLVLFAAVALWTFAIRITTPDISQLSLDAPENFFRTRLLQAALACFFIGAAVAAYWAAGYAATRRQFPLSGSRVDALLRGMLLSPAAAGSLATGAMAGGIIAALPYWVAATRLTTTAAISGVGGNLLASPLTAFFSVRDWLALLSAFAFVTPVMANRIRRPALARGLAALLGIVLMPGSIRGWSIAGFIVLAVSSFVAYDQIFRRVDLVAALAAATSAAASTFAAALLVQPAAALRSSGTTIGVGLVTATVLFAGRSLMTKRVEVPAQDAWSSSEAAEIGERERLLVDMSVAREAQQRLLPLAPPPIPGFSVASICRPAQRVGGDLYDFVPLTGGRWGIAVADVAGKGLPAAMYMSMTKGLLLAASDDRTDSLEILTDVNAGLYSVGQRNVFVTMLFAVLDPASREVAFVRAGHNSALWRRSATADTIALTPRGIALGMSSSKTFSRACTIERLVMQPGDKLFIYSDGVTEAMNERSEEYGDERLASAIERSDAAPPAAARDLILDDISAFVGQRPPHDDLTLVVLQALP